MLTIRRLEINSSATFGDNRITLDNLEDVLLKAKTDDIRLYLPTASGTDTNYWTIEVNQTLSLSELSKHFKKRPEEHLEFIVYHVTNTAYLEMLMRD